MKKVSSKDGNKLLISKIMILLLLPSLRTAFFINYSSRTASTTISIRSFNNFLSRLRQFRGSNTNSIQQPHDINIISAKTSITTCSTTTATTASEVQTTTNTRATGYNSYSNINELLPPTPDHNINNEDERDKNKLPSSKVSPIIDDKFERLFSISLPEGHCVGLRHLSSNDDSTSSNDLLCNNDHLCTYLHDEEINYCASLPSKTAQVTFTIGRVAMHVSLEELNNESKSKSEPSLDHVTKTTCATAILKDEYGRPIVPSGYLGSISHKKNIGVSLVDDDDNDIERKRRKRGIGIDLEQTLTRRNIDKRILTEKEINELGFISGVTRDEEVLLRFR